MTDEQKNTNIFSGLEHLGFDEVDNLELYGSPDKKEKKIEDGIQNEDDRQKNLLYDRELTCPVCQSIFKARAVKTSAARMLRKDSDLFIRYGNIDPYFYDVWLCNRCGYASMKRDFEKVKSYQIEKVQNEISLKWRGRNYPDIYDANIAIERFKLSLLNYYVIGARSSCKAMNCLKIAWMYRLLEDTENELLFLKQALDGFKHAYYNEDFPLYGMDRYTTMYLIGELNRRCGDDSEALLWFSNVITTPAVPQRIKDIARDQKDLIASLTTESINTPDASKETDQSNIKGFFSRFFK